MSGGNQAEKLLKVFKSREFIAHLNCLERDNPKQVEEIKTEMAKMEELVKELKKLREDKKPDYSALFTKSAELLLVAKRIVELRNEDKVLEDSVVKCGKELIAYSHMYNRLQIESLDDGAKVMMSIKDAMEKKTKVSPKKRPGSASKKRTTAK